MKAFFWIVGFIVFSSQLLWSTENEELFSIITLTSMTSAIEEISSADTFFSFKDVQVITAQAADTILLSHFSDGWDEDATDVSDSGEWSEDEIYIPSVPKDAPLRKGGKRSGVVLLPGDLSSLSREHEEGYLTQRRIHGKGTSLIPSIRTDSINFGDDNSGLTESRFVEACRLSFPRGGRGSSLAITESLSSTPTNTQFKIEIDRLNILTPRRPLILNKRSGASRIEIHPKNRGEILKNAPIYITPRFKSKEKDLKILKKISPADKEINVFTGVSYKFIYGYFGRYYIDEILPDKHKLIEFDVNTKFKIKAYKLYCDMDSLKKMHKESSLSETLEKYVYAHSLSIIWEDFPNFFDEWQERLHKLNKSCLKAFEGTFKEFLVKPDKSSLFKVPNRSLSELKDIILSPRSRNGESHHRLEPIKSSVLPFSPRPTLPVLSEKPSEALSMGKIQPSIRREGSDGLNKENLTSPRVPSVVVYPDLQQLEIQTITSPVNTKTQKKGTPPTQKHDPFQYFNEKLRLYNNPDNVLWAQSNQILEEINARIPLVQIFSWCLHLDEINKEFQDEVKLFCKESFLKRFLKRPSPYDNDIFENELNKYFSCIMIEVKEYEYTIKNLKNKYYYILCLLDELTTYVEISVEEVFTLKIIDKLFSGLKDLGEILKKYKLPLRAENHKAILTVRT